MLLVSRLLTEAQKSVDFARLMPDGSMQIDDLRRLTSQQLDAISRQMRAMGYDSRGGQDALRYLRKQAAYHSITNDQLMRMSTDEVQAELEKQIDNPQTHAMHIKHEDWAKAIAQVLGISKPQKITRPAGDVLRKAVKELGTTGDWRRAGYIMPDGRLLDLGGGGDPTRGHDHRIVGNYVPEKDESATELMWRFMERGPIRIGLTRDNRAFADMRRAPTSAQLAMLGELVKTAGGRLTLDVRSATANDNREYQNLTPGVLQAHIAHFYRHGQLPAASRLSQYHEPEEE